MLIRSTRARGARPFARRGRTLDRQHDRSRRRFDISGRSSSKFAGIAAGNFILRWNSESERLGLATLCETLEYGSRKQVRDQAGRIRATERVPASGLPKVLSTRKSDEGARPRLRHMAQSYIRPAGIKHGVTNTGESHMASIEIEIKRWRLLMWLCSGLGWRARS